jgi:hypothetical protein
MDGIDGGEESLGAHAAFAREFRVFFESTLILMNLDHALHVLFLKCLIACNIQSKQIIIVLCKYFSYMGEREKYIAAASELTAEIMTTKPE